MQSRVDNVFPCVRRENHSTICRCRLGGCGGRQVAVLVWKCLNFQTRRSHDRAVPDRAIP